MKIKLLSLLFIPFFAQAQLNNPALINVTEDMLHIELGSSFNYKKSYEHTQLFDVIPTTGESPLGSKFTYTLVNDQSDLAKIVAGNGNLAYRNLTANFSAGFGFSNSELSNKHMLRLCIIYNYTTSVDKINKNLTVEDLLPGAVLDLYNSDPARFSEQYGDYYVESIEKGGRVYVFIDMAESLESTVSMLSADFKGKYSSGATEASAFANFNSAYRNSVQNKSVNIEISNSGGIGLKNVDFLPILKMDNLDSALNQIAIMLENAARTGEGVPIRFQVAPLKNILPRLSVSRLNTNFSKAETYYNYWKNYSAIHNNINILTTGTSLSQEDKEYLDSLSIELQNEKDKLAAINNLCLDEAKCENYKYDTKYEFDSIYLKSFYITNKQPLIDITLDNIPIANTGSFETYFKIPESIVKKLNLNAVTITIETIIDSPKNLSFTPRGKWYANYDSGTKQGSTQWIYNGNASNRIPYKDFVNNVPITKTGDIHFIWVDENTYYDDGKTTPAGLIVETINFKVYAK